MPREIFRPLMLFPRVRSLFRLQSPSPASSPFSGFYLRFVSSNISHGSVPCLKASKGSANGRKNAPARLTQVQKFLVAANEPAQSAGIEPTPKITLNHVTVNFGRSGGPRGQNVNEVNTKVYMQFDVGNADWLNERVKKRIMQMEKNRINNVGELVIRSTKTRTRKGNIEDALANLQVFMRLMKKFQAIIDEASYIPPPPSEETVKKITLAATGGHKRLGKKKVHSQKKAFGRSQEN